MSQGYLPLGTSSLPADNAQLRSALTNFQVDTGLVISGEMDFFTYERALRNYVKLAADGTLARVGWTQDGAAITAVGSAHVAQTIATAPAVNKVLLQIENPAPAGERLPFEQGEQIFLSAIVTRSAHLYCYFADAKGSVMRLLPNAVNPNTIVAANMSVRIPDWMTPNPAFIMDASTPGTERVGCFAAETDPMQYLPAPLQGPALRAIPGFATMDDVSDAFSQSLGPTGFVRGEIEWRVTAKPSPTVAPVTPAASAARAAGTGTGAPVPAR